MTDQPRRTDPPRAVAGAGYFVRDVLAVLFLLLPLGMAWDLERRAISHDFIVPVTLLSILSVALPYLRSASVLPKAITAPTLRRVRLLANVPYLVVVLTTLVRAYADDVTENGVNDGAGVGMGVVFALVGVMMAAQGRSAQQHARLADGALWRTVAVVLAGLGVGLAVVSAVVFAAELTGELTWSEFVILGLGAAFFAGIPLIAVSGLARGDGAGRDATVAIGVVGLVVALWAQGAQDTMESAWSLRLAGPQILLWPALGAVAAAPGVGALVVPSRGAARWVDLSGKLFQMVTVVAVFAMLLSGFRLIDNVEDRGEHIAGIVFALVIIMAATFGRSALLRNAPNGRAVALGAASVLISVMIVQTTVIGMARSLAITVDVATILSLWLVFGCAIVMALTAPKSVRERLAQAPPSEFASQPDDSPAVPSGHESTWGTRPDAEGPR